jgi:hypothetical protein
MSRYTAISRLPLSFHHEPSASLSAPDVQRRTRSGAGHFRGVAGSVRGIAADFEARLRPLPRRNGERSPRVIVSLTTQPSRIAGVSLTVRSIQRQSTPADAIVLVLSEEEFPRRDLPRGLLRDLMVHGAEVLWTKKDIGSYKKLLPTREVDSTDVIVTADDDVIYPRWWLRELISRHESAPESIIGHRAAEIAIGPSGPLPYVTWRRASEDTPSRLLFFTGLGGILYPPASLPKVAFDVSLARQLCPTADDIWFKVASLVSGSQLKKASDRHGNFPVNWRARSTIALHHVNVHTGQNDLQFSRALTYFGLQDALKGSSTS